MTAADIYWKVEPELALTATEKAGFTSIQAACSRYLRLSADMVQQRGLRTCLYVRHPIVRFASAYAYFAPNDNFPIQPSRAAYLLADHPTLEAFTDAVLAGMPNEHWQPQLAQHTIPIDEIYRFENINDTWSWNDRLQHHNKGRIEKPVIQYRLAELEAYYDEDLAAWENALK